MRIFEWYVQQVRSNKWMELEELNIRFDAIEKRYGVPPKRRYVSMAGAFDENTLVVAREWESLAAAEATYEKLLADPEYTRLMEESKAILKATRRELYTVLS